jgi:hypothetical protein
MTSAICMTGRGVEPAKSRGGWLPQAPGVALFDRSMDREARRWPLAAGWRAGIGLINDYLGCLADRGYMPQPARADAFGLLAFARWLAAGRLALGEVSADVVLGYLAYCRQALPAGRPGGNVYSIRDGRNTGYAPATINRRLASVSGLFGYGAMRDPAMPSPIPRRAEARRAAAGERSGLPTRLARRSGALACGSASRGGCPAAWTAPRPPCCWRASAPIRKGVPGH